MTNLAIHIRAPGDDAQPATVAASFLDRSQGASYLLHNVYHADIMELADHHDEVMTEVRELLLERRRRQLARLAKGLGSAEVRLSCAASAWQAIVNFVDEHAIDLLISEIAAASRWQRLVLGSDDWQLIRHCPVPLLLVKPGTAKRYSVVIAAVDPTHARDKPAQLDRAILRSADRLARQHDCALMVISVIEPITNLPDLTFAGGIAPSSAAVAERRQLVDQLVREAGCDGARVDTPIGLARDGLVQCAQQHSDCALVMGAVSRSTFRRLLIGMTAEAVLDQVPCDVLVTNAQTTPV